MPTYGKRQCISGISRRCTIQIHIMVLYFTSHTRKTEMISDRAFSVRLLLQCVLEFRHESHAFSQFFQEKRGELILQFCVHARTLNREFVITFSIGVHCKYCVTVTVIAVSFLHKIVYPLVSYHTWGLINVCTVQYRFIVGAVGLVTPLAGTVGNSTGCQFLNGLLLSWPH